MSTESLEASAGGVLLLALVLGLEASVRELSQERSRGLASSANLLEAVSGDRLMPRCSGRVQTQPTSLAVGPFGCHIPQQTEPVLGRFPSGGLLPEVRSDAAKLAAVASKVGVGSGGVLSRISRSRPLGGAGDFGVRLFHLPQERRRISSVRRTGWLTLPAGASHRRGAAQEGDEEHTRYQRTSRASRCCCPLTVVPLDRSSAPTERKVTSAVSQSSDGTAKVKTKWVGWRVTCRS